MYSSWENAVITATSSTICTTTTRETSLPTYKRVNVLELEQKLNGICIQLLNLCTTAIEALKLMQSYS